MSRYGVQIKRDPNPRLPLAMRRIASKRGEGEPYTVCDLYRDCLIAYTDAHTSFANVEHHNNFITRTVYVRDNGGEHDKFLTLAKSGGLTSLGKLLEAAIKYCLDDEINMQLAIIAKQEEVAAQLTKTLGRTILLGEPYHANQNDD